MNKSIGDDQRPFKVEVQGLTFIGEQDGPPEAELKQALRKVFLRDKRVSSASLARAQYNSDQLIHIVLCVRSPANKELVTKCSDIFKQIFARHEHLDILFLTDEQERELVKVCKPFFFRAT